MLMNLDGATTSFRSVLIDSALGLQAKMLGIAGVDLLVGTIPVFGDWFDFAHKANARIARLLAEELRAQRDRGR